MSILGGPSIAKMTKTSCLSEKKDSDGRTTG